MNVAYYNEIDPCAAQWLRNLIASGHIAPGVVDERSIEDVHPDDLRGFTQCHFFAGIGVWSYALRLAGWPDDRPVWTGSCPCQPFSAAGKGAGFADERHLWPAFHHLIKECRPSVVFGEQVASKDADPWIDLVHTDMEALGYAFGAVPFPSAGVGAPHIRDRLYWVAHTSDQRQHGRRPSSQGDGRNAAWVEPQRLCNADGVADRNQHGCGAQPFGELQHAQHHAEPRGGVSRMEYPGHDHDAGQGQTASAGQPQANRPANIASGSGVSFGGVADAELQQRPDRKSGVGHEYDARGRVEGAAASARLCSDLRPGPINGFWRAADWIFCRDGKWRPVEPGTFPLAHGAPARVGRLRAYGNAINAEAARAFIEASM